MKKNYPNIRKKAEFEEFIKILEGNIVDHWINIADAIGVDKDTITEWKKHPRAKEAIQNGVKRALEGMEKAGDKDWRMWESKLKMLGVSPLEKKDITSGGEKIEWQKISYKDIENDSKNDSL